MRIFSICTSTVLHRFFSLRPTEQRGSVAGMYRPAEDPLVCRNCLTVTTPKDLPKGILTSLGPFLAPEPQFLTHAPPQPQRWNPVCKPTQMQKCLVRSMSPCLQINLSLFTAQSIESPRCVIAYMVFQIGVASHQSFFFFLVCWF